MRCATESANGKNTASRPCTTPTSPGSWSRPAKSTSYGPRAMRRTWCRATTWGTFTPNLGSTRSLPRRVPVLLLRHRGVGAGQPSLRVMGQELCAGHGAAQQLGGHLRPTWAVREVYRVASLYYSYVTGELEQASQVYELWAKSYAQDMVPRNNLGDIYAQLGQYEKSTASRPCTTPTSPGSWSRPAKSTSYGPRAMRRTWCRATTWGTFMPNLGSTRSP